MVAKTGDEPGPGLHVVRHTDPNRRAEALAGDSGADLCRGDADVDRVVAERRPLASVDAAALDHLAALAGRLSRAQVAAERTRQRATVEASRRLSPGAGLAVHPSTVRERAAAVERARAALLEAERALTDLHPAEATDPAPGSSGGEPVAPRVDAAASDRGQRSRLRRQQAIGALLAAFGLALVGLAVGLPLWAVLILPLVVALWAMRHLEEPPVDDYEERASTRLAEVAAETDEVFGIRRPSTGGVASLQVAVTRAQEELRVAERAWTDLAGEGSDPADVESVVSRFDPQHEDARLLVDASPGVRAVETVLERARRRWVDAWVSLGLPEPDDGPDAVADLARRVTRPVVLVGQATARADEVAEVVPAAAVLVLEEPAPEG